MLDETGVGRPVADIFNTAALNPTRVAIGSGLEVTQRDGRSFTVPKGHLISGLEAKMHCGEFKIAPSISAALLDELKDFKRKVSESGRATYDARSGAHDVLILACAIGVWLATNGSGEVTCEPIWWMEPDPAGWYRAQSEEPKGYRQ